MPLHRAALDFLDTHLDHLAWSLEHNRDSLPDHAHVFDGGIDGLVREVTASGSYYFTDSALAFFDAQNHELINARFLITSRQFEGSDGVKAPRTYHVLWFVPRADGVLASWSLDTDFASVREAVDAAHALGEYLAR